jgi:copper chaperone CopZ
VTSRSQKVSASKTYRITGIHCGGCAASTGTHCQGCSENLETVLSGLQGVHRVRVNLPGRRATIEYDPALFDEAKATQAVAKACFRMDTWN